ncbi:MAG: type II secretion system protein GspM [Gemmatimonadaceae bacterium]
MRPDARERRTIRWAIWVSALALIAAFVVAPFARRVAERADQLAVRREHVERLSSYIVQKPALDSSMAATDRLLRGSSMRVIRGRSPALAASELQRVLQEYARMSRVSVSRLDVASGTDSTTNAAIPATVSAVGDIYGLVQLLAYLERGSIVVEVDTLAVQSTSGLRGDLLQLSLQLHAPFLVDAP